MNRGTSGSKPERWTDAVAVTALALGVRLAVVVWAAPRFPPAADGAYYHRIAARIGEGLGYTWLWPDGAVTFAAHYPVGFPGAIGALYAVLGPQPWLAMVLNAALGSLAALAVHRAASRFAPRRASLLAGLLVAVHPGLCAYTPALMTEGVTAALIACAVWATTRARETGAGTAWLLVLALIVGSASLVRPQTIVFAPLFAWLTVGQASPGKHLRAILVTTTLALAVPLPWTLRNCVRMDRCAFVSVNGGWNLLIGTNASSKGGWSPIEVPEPCRTIWGEAEKDACFGREARRAILAQPIEWLGLAHRKVASTFDYCGAGGWYLHESNPEALNARGKYVLGAVETLYERLLLLLALGLSARTDWAWTRFRGPARTFAFARLAIAALGAGFLVHVHAWMSYAAFAVLALARRRPPTGESVLAPAAGLVILATMLTHAVFFGSGRYSMVVFPLVAGLAATGLGPRPDKDGDFDTGAAPPAS